MCFHLFPLSKLISISIVSHDQGSLVGTLLNNLALYIDPACIEVILTKNVSELLSFAVEDSPYPITVVENVAPKGFGANHNAAFRLARGKWFCVLNPDIRLNENPFPLLLKEIAQQDAAVISPAVLSPTGKLEDSVSRFPTLLSLVGKMLGGNDGRYPFVIGDETFSADWVGGMFMLFRSDYYKRVVGFDEHFFLYYEDVDICARLWKAGGRVLACPKVQVIHDARRTSRRDLRYLRWHVTSMARYFWKHWGRLPRGTVS